MLNSEKIKQLLEGVAADKIKINQLEASIKLTASKVGYMYKVGDKVSLGSARVGTIKEIYVETVTINIDGTDVTKEANANNPAYLVIEGSGHAVLRLGTEIDSSARNPA